MKSIWQKTFFLFGILCATNLVAVAQTLKSGASFVQPLTITIFRRQTNFQNAFNADYKSLSVKRTVKTRKDKTNPQSRMQDLQPTDLPVEKAVAVDSKINVSFCSAAHKVTVRGWQRNEVRVFIEDGKANVNFKVMERAGIGPESKPEWLIIQGFGAKNKTSGAAQEECLRGDTVLIEVPKNARVTVKSVESKFDFDSIASVRLSNVSGDVELRNISEETEVSSLSGNLLVEDSSGKITLKSIEGDVIASRLKPNGFSDALKFNSTSGNVILKNVLHKNIEAASNSGEVVVVDSLTRGGNYDFNTVNGAVLLALPVDFPFQVKATINSRGSFRADFPIKINAQKLSGQSRLFTATNGSGESIINLTTFNGNLRLHQK